MAAWVIAKKKKDQVSVIVEGDLPGLKFYVQGEDQAKITITCRK